MKEFVTWYSFLYGNYTENSNDTVSDVILLIHSIVRTYYDTVPLPDS